MKTLNYEGVVLSLDGIVTNTYTLFINITTELLAKHGIDVDPYFFELILDGGNEANFRAFYHFHHYKVYEQEMFDTYYQHLQELTQTTDALLNPEFIELYQHLLASDVKVGLVSSLPKRIAQQLIDHLSFNLKYDQLVCGNEILQGKPEKDIYTKMARLLNVHPNKTLAIDASMNGILGSYLAGMRNVFVESISLRNQRSQRYSNVQLKHLSDLMLVGQV